jgi:pentatricopeptide repeat protein
MISGYTQRGCFVEALELFQQMRLTDVKPNSVTLTSLLPACANLAALEKGKEVHEDIIRNGFQSDIFVGNALIDMYAKCGSIDDADKMFHKMHRRDVVSWSSMIVGYAVHGRAYDALQLFKEMQHLGTKPDYVTLVGVLSACCHAGLVDDARQYFDCMTSDYGIKPGLEHYSCMVDLLGRAGRLIEAWNIINKMPMKPDVIVWGSLLAACRVHSNVDLGEYAAERLFQLDPENAAHYVLLSNMYATVGRWDGVRKMRRMMKDRRVKKMPGCSWIGFNYRLNTFVVGSSLHPQN